MTTRRIATVEAYISFTRGFTIRGSNDIIRMPRDGTALAHNFSIHYDRRSAFVESHGSHIGSAPTYGTTMRLQTEYIALPTETKAAIASECVIKKGRAFHQRRLRPRKVRRCSVLSHSLFFLRDPIWCC